MPNITQEQLIMMIEMIEDPNARPFALKQIRPYIEEYIQNTKGVALEAVEEGLETAVKEFIAATSDHVGDWMYHNKDTIQSNPRPVLVDRAKNIIGKSLKGFALGAAKSLFLKKLDQSPLTRQQ